MMEGQQMLSRPLKKQEGWLGHSEAVPQMRVFLGHRCAMPQPPTSNGACVLQRQRRASPAANEDAGSIRAPILSHGRRRGSSLVEVAISCVLVGVMLVASMRTVGAVFRTRLVASQQQDGKSLAHELMAEILQTYHEEPSLPEGSIGLEAAETGDGSRALWDDVDDYHGWSASPPEFKDGTALPGATGWTRQVVVDRVTCPAPETTSGSDTGLKQIQVTATSPSSQTFTIYALRSRWGVLELKPPLNTTYVTGLSGELQAGATGDTVVGGTAVVNHAEGP